MNDTLEATTKITGSLIQENNANMGYISQPKDAFYQSTTSSVTGALRICLPTHGTADMV